MSFRIIRYEGFFVSLQLKSYKKCIISKKKYESISKHLIEILKMIYGWKKVDEENAKMKEKKEKEKEEVINYLFSLKKRERKKKF